jgi:hypothetical protein
MTLINALDGQTAALDERRNRILAASPGAWRYLGWRIFDPQVNRLRILPNTSGHCRSGERGTAVTTPPGVSPPA